MMQKYWIVGGDTSRIWSREAAGYVSSLPADWHPTGDAARAAAAAILGPRPDGRDELEYMAEVDALVDAEKIPSWIATEEELGEVLASFGLPGPIVDLAAYAADKRRSLVNGATTISLGSREISTWVDPESRGAATGLVVACTLAPEMAAPWKGADGQFYILDAAEITSLAMGMMVFVQTCFACEASVLAQISGGTITTAAAIDAAPWPA